MKKLLTFCLSLALCIVPVTATHLSDAVTETGSYLLETVQNPQVDTIGGEWAVIGLARSGLDVPQDYWDGYYETVVDTVTDCQGNLHSRKYTEYSRVALALTAIGADPRDVGGYNLLVPLGDYEKTIWQGMNGPIWALIALDSGDYDIPQNPDTTTLATRQMYVDCILAHQSADGGWNLQGDVSAPSEPDITGMALQALANYQDQRAVNTATGRALACISKHQDAEGGFTGWGSPNVESNVQILVGLTALGTDLDAPAFTKNGNNILDNLLTFRQDGGAFNHTKTGSGDSLMSTEQGFYAMVAALRQDNGESGLYEMDDVTISVTGVNSPEVGLVGKHPDVTPMPVVGGEIAFPDIENSPYAPAILELTARTIINGSGDGLFHPKNTMTRAEFAKIMVCALGLPLESTNQFTDVNGTDWFAPYVGTAYGYGIVNGTSETTFNPQGTITRQEVAVMVARAAKLCGMDTDFDTTAIRNTLAVFFDYVTVADYAQSSVAFCYDTEILDPSVMEIKPKEAITRGEVSQMVYNLLKLAQLL